MLGVDEAHLIGAERVAQALRCRPASGKAPVAVAGEFGGRCSVQLTTPGSALRAFFDRASGRR